VPIPIPTLTPLPSSSGLAIGRARRSTSGRSIRPLNPYDPAAVPSILKLEDVNFLPSGEVYPVTTIDDSGRAGAALLQTYGTVFSRYARHPEAKSLDSTGSPGRGPGLLLRRPVREGSRAYVRKEPPRSILGDVDQRRTVEHGWAGAEVDLAGFGCGRLQRPTVTPSEGNSVRTIRGLEVPYAQVNGHASVPAYPLAWNRGVP
jgi:hypothetical protein